LLKYPRLLTAKIKEASISVLRPNLMILMNAEIPAPENATTEFAKSLMLD